MNYRDNIVLKPGPGVTINVTESQGGKFIIEAEIIDVKTEGYGDYTNPPIPKGFKHVKGEWDTGFVIERKSDGSKFIWIPVGALPPNGTIDEENYNERFGIRKTIEGNNSEYYDAYTKKFAKQVESVKKYGGFYISMYKVSIDKKGNHVCKRGYKPIVNISYNQALSIASSFEENEEVSSHLVYGAEYDSEYEWVNTLENVIHNIDRYGEWTQERYCSHIRVVRCSFSAKLKGDVDTPCIPISKAPNIGCRVALWIK